MNKNVLMGAGLAAALVVGGVLLAGSEKSPPATKAASGQVKAEETKPLGEPAHAQVTLPAGADATAVYTALTAEIKTLAENATSPEAQTKAFGEIDAKLKAFQAKYPGTPESLDAEFQLGALCFGTEKFPEAERHLTTFVGKVDESQREQVAFARFYLAEVYKAQGKYDEAAGEYKLVLSKYSDVNPKLTQIVQTNYAGLDAERKLAIGSEPIAFRVQSIAGKTLSPADYKGKVLLIDFWATWCGPCVMEMPNVKSVYGKYHDKGFEIVGISLDQSREKLDGYIAQQEIVWPQYFDGKWWNNDVAVMYGIKSIPTTVLIDRKGKIRYKTLRGKQLESAVQELLNEKV